MAKTRAPSNPLSAILRAGRKSLQVDAVLPSGEPVSFTLTMPPSKVRAGLLEALSGESKEDAATMMTLCEGAVKACLSDSDDLTDDDVSDLVAMTGGIQGDLAVAALRLCGLAKGRSVGKQSPLPTGSSVKSEGRSKN